MLIQRSSFSQDESTLSSLQVAFEKVGPMPMSAISKQRRKQQREVTADLKDRLTKLTQPPTTTFAKPSPRSVCAAESGHLSETPPPQTSPEAGGGGSEGGGGGGGGGGGEESPLARRSDEKGRREFMDDSDCWSANVSEEEEFSPRVDAGGAREAVQQHAYEALASTDDFRVVENLGGCETREVAPKELELWNRKVARRTTGRVGGRELAGALSGGGRAVETQRMEGLARGLRGLQGLANDKAGENGVYPPWGVVLDRDVSGVLRSQSARGVLEEARRKEVAVVETSGVESLGDPFSRVATKGGKDVQSLDAEGMSGGMGDGRGRGGRWERDGEGLRV